MIELHFQNKPIYINEIYITQIIPMEDCSASKIVLLNIVDKSWITVDETPQEILTKIESNSIIQDERMQLIQKWRT